MSRKQIVSWLAVGLLILTTGSQTASAQGIEDLQLFAPANLSSYGGGPQPNEGYFFNFDWLGWSIPRPAVSPVGFPNLTRTVYYNTNIVRVQHNTHDTSGFKDQYKHGQRVEFGRVEDGCGWLFSTYRFPTTNQTINATGMDVVFQDIAFGAGGHKFLEGYTADFVGGDGSATSYENFEIHDLPLSFDEVKIQNRVNTYSLELMFMKRLRPFHHGGNLELFLGVRYMQFDDQFNVDARGIDRFTYLDGPGGTPEGDDDDDDDDDSSSSSSDETQGTIVTGPRSILGDSEWHTKANNRIVGPQLGARWFKKKNRWTLSAEGRFFAGYNQQTIRQSGMLGSQLNDGTPYTFEAGTVPGLPYIPLYMDPVSFEHREFKGEWSPGAELRLQAAYQVTRAFTIRAGWTGFWMDGLARGSNMVNYTLSETQIMGINMDNNRQEIFTHGLNVGLEFNR